jgi:hypothetical protein
MVSASAAAQAKKQPGRSLVTINRRDLIVRGGVAAAALTAGAAATAQAQQTPAK